MTSNDGNRSDSICPDAPVHPRTPRSRTPLRSLAPVVAALGSTLLSTIGLSCLGPSPRATAPPPPVVQPAVVPALYRSPPSDALILFDGNGLDAWSRRNGKPAAWNHTDAYFEVAPWRGSIQTREAFGDVQLHLEWMIPAGSRGRGQHRGNSGVKLMGHYEIQILDSFQNETYPTGLAGAVYGQTPPLVNASLPQGEWQAFDIVFRRPHFDAEGRLVRAASVTVFHNGVIVQDAVPLTGPTSGQSRPYEAHPSRLPLLLQDHRRRVRFRNVWIRDLE